MTSVIHLINKPQRRGAELFALGLAKGLSESFDSRVVSIHSNGDEPVIEAQQLLRLNAKISQWNRFGLNWPAFLKLRRIVREAESPVVVAHGSATLKYAAMLKIIGPRPKVIYRCIGVPSFWAGNRFKRMVNGLLFRTVDAVVCVSEASRADFLKTYGLPDSVVSFIPNGVNIDEFYSRQTDSLGNLGRSALNLPKDVPVLVTIGNISHEKNQAELIHVASDLSCSGMDVYLVIIGDGPLRSELEQLARQLKIADHIRFAGLLDDVRPVLAAADVFVLSSKTEGMPGAVIEAGLSGVPTIAYDVGGISEVIDNGETGILVTPGDRKAFAKSVASVLDDRLLLNRTGQTAAVRFREKFDLAKIVDQYDTLLRSLFAEAPGVSDAA